MSQRVSSDFFPVFVAGLLLIVAGGEEMHAVKAPGLVFDRGRHHCRTFSLLCAVLLLQVFPILPVKSKTTGRKSE